jgi:hypothetical protein
MASAHSVDKGTWIWIGVAAGAAVGIGVAMARGRRKRWDSAAKITRRIREGSEDLADRTKDLVTRVRNIYDESLKVVDEAGGLWARGRKLVRT